MKTIDGCRKIRSSPYLIFHPSHVQRLLLRNSRETLSSPPRASLMAMMSVVQCCHQAKSRVKYYSALKIEGRCWFQWCYELTGSSESTHSMWWMYDGVITRGGMTSALIHPMCSLLPTLHCRRGGKREMDELCA